MKSWARLGNFDYESRGDRLRFLVSLRIRVTLSMLLLATLLSAIRKVGILGRRVHGFLGWPSPRLMTLSS